jgi:hypothetical protein
MLHEQPSLVLRIQCHRKTKAAGMHEVDYHQRDDYLLDIE